VGKVNKLGKAPGDTSTGHYSAHFDAASQTEKADPSHYFLDMPAYRKVDAMRGSRLVPVVPAHEALAEEIAATPEFARLLEDSLPNLPPAYHEHPVVRSTQGLVAPVALYMDGVAFGTRESVLGFFLLNLTTGRRHLLAALRKGWQCKCGCGGYCSLFPILRCLRWGVDALARGSYPEGRHDSRPWAASDATRAELAGCDLGCQAAVLYVKGDLMEFAVTLGFPTTASLLQPCPFCWAPKADMLKVETWDVLSSPWRLKSWEEYCHACDSCEQWRLITSDDHVTLLSLLHYDKRRASNSSRGLALTQAVESLQLLRGDRLEPCDSLQDVSTFPSLATFPVWVLFWRPSAETLVHHRNQLFSEAAGLKPHASLALDWLHVLSLCVSQFYCSFAVHQLFGAHAWQVGESA